MKPNHLPLALALLALAPLAAAQAAPPPAAASKSAEADPILSEKPHSNSGYPVALVADVALGPAELHWGGNAIAADVVGRLRWGALEIGAVASGWETIFGPAHNSYYGVLAGYQQAFGGPFHLELLAEGGWHDEEHTIGVFFDPHLRSSVVLPYAGLRAGLDARLGSRFRVVVGLWGVLRTDLKSKHLMAGSEDLGVAGGTSAAVLLRVGFELGLGDG